MSVVETILSNLKSALESISVSKGYSLDVKHVTREQVGLTDMRDDKMPMLAISNNTEESPLGQIGTKHRILLPVVIMGAIKGSENLQTNSVNFRADLKKCLHGASLGDNVLYLRLKECPVQEGDKIVTFAQMIEICYYYEEANP